MSSHEAETGQQAEQKSSISITRNAKGEAQFAVKVYEGAEAGELARLRELAVENYKALNAVYFGGRA